MDWKKVWKWVALGSVGAAAAYGAMSASPPSDRIAFVQKANRTEGEVEDEGDVGSPQIAEGKREASNDFRRSLRAMQDQRGRYSVGNREVRYNADLGDGHVHLAGKPWPERLQRVDERDLSSAERWMTPWPGAGDDSLTTLSSKAAQDVWQELEAKERIHLVHQNRPATPEEVVDGFVTPAVAFLIQLLATFCRDEAEDQLRQTIKDWLNNRTPPDFNDRQLERIQAAVQKAILERSPGAPPDHATAKTVSQAVVRHLLRDPEHHGRHL